MKNRPKYALVLLIAITFIAQSLMAQQTGQFTDPRDGQVYKTVKIGNQTWMAENLNYKTANSWCYDNDEAYCAIYGRLYTFDAAKNACPDGWHLPSDVEWNILTDFLGGDSIAGGKLKEAGTAHWESPNFGATNSSGFTALPGGGGNSEWSFKNLGSFGQWAVDPEGTGSYNWSRLMRSSSEWIGSGDPNFAYGISVRCIKDIE